MTPIRAKCLGCQIVALRPEYEATASSLLVRISCATCGGKRIASVAEGGVEMENAEREYLRSRSEPPPLRDIRVPEPDVPVEEELSDEQLRAELDDDPALLATVVPPISGLAEGIARRDAAIDQAVEAADPEWISRARAAIEEIASVRELFTTDAVWALLDRRGIERPREGRAMAGVTEYAVRLGWIEPTEEYRSSARPEAHAGPKRVYRSLRRAS